MYTKLGDYDSSPLSGTRTVYKRYCIDVVTSSRKTFLKYIYGEEIFDYAERNNFELDISLSRQIKHMLFGSRILEMEEARYGIDEFSKGRRRKTCAQCNSSPSAQKDGRFY